MTTQQILQHLHSLRAGDNLHTSTGLALERLQLVRGVARTDKPGTVWKMTAKGAELLNLETKVRYRPRERSQLCH